MSLHILKRSSQRCVLKCSVMKGWVKFAGRGKECCFSEGATDVLMLQCFRQQKLNRCQLEQNFPICRLHFYIN